MSAELSDLSAGALRDTETTNPPSGLRRRPTYASDLPLTDGEARVVDELRIRNFDHVDRYVMPLKSSV
jgi:hypothetical protein